MREVVRVVVVMVLPDSECTAIFCVADILRDYVCDVRRK
jgi:hypothetical protein